MTRGALHGVGSGKEDERSYKNLQLNFPPPLGIPKKQGKERVWNGNYQVRLSWPSVCIRLANGHAMLELSIGRETWL